MFRLQILRESKLTEVRFLPARTHSARTQLHLQSTQRTTLRPSKEARSKLKSKAQSSKTEQAAITKTRLPLGLWTLQEQNQVSNTPRLTEKTKAETQTLQARNLKLTKLSQFGRTRLTTTKKNSKLMKNMLFKPTKTTTQSTSTLQEQARGSWEHGRTTQIWKSILKTQAERFSPNGSATERARDFAVFPWTMEKSIAQMQKKFLFPKQNTKNGVTAEANHDHRFTFTTMLETREKSKSKHTLIWLPRNSTSRRKTESATGSGRRTAFKKRATNLWILKRKRKLSKIHSRKQLSKVQNRLTSAKRKLLRLRFTQKNRALLLPQVLMRTTLKKSKSK